jgi:predicted helicase
MQTFLTVGGTRKKAGGAGIDFDELGVSDVIDLLDDAQMEAVVRDFGDRNPQEDPVVHFYELFLKEYDPQKRMQRGVFYTPRPAVSYIVRSVDNCLRAEFGLDDGLADLATWEDMATRHVGFVIPDGVDPHGDFVQILDPALGTGTFLVEVIDVIYDRLMTKWQSLDKETKLDRWNSYVSDHLLSRLYGFELLMAPYSIAHMKIGLKLHETGYRFASNERARVFLTNSLEAPRDDTGRLDLVLPARAHEARAVDEVKRQHRFTIVIGNPPYSQMSQNLGAQERELVAPYRRIGDVPIYERGAITFERNLQDDYVKFGRLAEIAVTMAGCGVIGLITNHSFLSNITLRGMRYHLMQTFDRIVELDLHGSSQIHEEAPGKIRDENIFDIQQGVAISLWLRRVGRGVPPLVEYAELWGSRAEKSRRLLEPNEPQRFSRLSPGPEYYFFVRRDDEVDAEYRTFRKLTDIFNVYGSAITTARDRVVVDFEDAPICDRVSVFQSNAFSDAEVLATLGLSESAIWQVSKARKALRGIRAGDHIIDFAYRPFDQRRLFYDDALVSSPRRPTMQYLGAGSNLALAVCRQQGVPGFKHVFVSRILFDEGLVSNRSREKTVCFPLYLTLGPDETMLQGSERPNLRDGLLEEVVAGIIGGDELHGFSAADLFAYVYAILHCPTYRRRYAEGLMRDFPRVSFPRNGKLASQLVGLGEELLDLHLLEAIALEPSGASYFGPEVPIVGRATWAEEVVWLDASGGTASARACGGFGPVREDVWTFEIGAYHVCEKWLKDRRGRKLTPQDVQHYGRILTSVAGTIDLMAKVGDVVEKHGGWPAAFRDVESR